MNWKVYIILLLLPISLILPQTDTITAGGNLFFPDSTLVTHGINVSIYNLDNYLLASDTSDENGHWAIDKITGIDETKNQNNLTKLNAYYSYSKIVYEVPYPSDIVLRIYNILGQQVSSFSFSNVKTGTHFLNWDFTNSNGNQLANGIYILQISTEKETQINKLLKVDQSVYNSSLKLNSNYTRLAKIKTGEYKIRFLDQKRVVRYRVLQSELFTNMVTELKELIQYNNQPHTLEEGDTLQIPLSDFEIKTGQVKEVQVNNPDVNWFISNGILNIYNQDTNYAGNRQIPLTITAPHDSDTTFTINANWIYMTRFTLQVQDIINNDTTIYTPTTLVLDKDPDTTSDDNIFFSNENGIISGKIKPGRYRAVITNDNMWRVFKIEAGNQNIVYRRNWENYFSIEPYPYEDLNLTADLEGVIRMVNKNYQKDIYTRIWDATMPYGVDLWAPLPGSDLGSIKTVISEIGPDAPVDEKTINVYLWTDGTLPADYQSYNSGDDFNPIFKTMTEEFKQQLITHFNGRFKQFLQDQYTINIYEGNTPPLRKVEAYSGYIGIIEKNGWLVIHASDRPRNYRVFYGADNDNRTWSGRVTLQNGAEIGEVESETGSIVGPSTDIVDNTPGKDISLYNQTGTQIVWTEFDFNSQKLSQIFDRGFSFFK